MAEERKAPAEVKCGNRGAELLDDEMQAAVTERRHGTAAGEQRRRGKKGMSGRRRRRRGRARGSTDEGRHADAET